VVPRTAARKRALWARLDFLVVRFMWPYNRRNLQHDLEINELSAIGLRTVQEKIETCDEVVTSV